MGCCFSKKRTKHPDGSADFPRRYKPEDRDPPPPPSPEEEKVKEVLSETPTTKAAVEPKPVANVVAVEEQEVFKAKPSAAADAAVSDLGSCFSMATDERSEAASESSVATSSVAGPERSPGKPARRRPVSGELGLARRDRAAAAAAAYGVRSRSCRASPSPPPRRDPPPRDRSVRRSPSPAAKRPPAEQHRATSPAAPLQRKPPVPSRRASPHRARESPPPPPLSPPPQPEGDAVVTEGVEDDRVAEANASGDGEQGHGGDSDGEGKESLENPLVSMECFIFL
uniref:Uncharacterized protein n=1 Tax=Avena sativa TaxID=4498 RepID=A0ACD5W2X8_AVESA